MVDEKTERSKRGCNKKGVIIYWRDTHVGRERKYVVCVRSCSFALREE